jgi:hypothetical protein
MFALFFGASLILVAYQVGSLFEAVRANLRPFAYCIRRASADKRLFP